MRWGASHFWATARAELARLRPAAVWDSPRVRVLRMAADLRPGLSALGALHLVALGTLPLLFTVATGRVVDAVPAAVAGGFASPAGAALVRAVLVTGAIFVVQIGLVPLLNVALQRLARRVSIAMTSRMIRTIGRPPGVAHLEDPSIQDEIAKAEGMFGTPPGSAIPGLIQLWASRLVGVGGFILVGRYSWWLAAAISVSIAVDRAVWRKRYDDITAAIFDRGDVHRRSAWFRDALITPEASKETRVFGLQSWLVDRQHTTWSEAMEPVLHRMRGRPLLEAAFMLRTPVLIVATLALLVRSALRGGTELGQLVVVVQGLMQLQNLGASGDVDYTISRSVATLPAARELERRLAMPEFALPGTEPAAGLPGEVIRFEQVTFRYAGRDQEVFDGLDLEIPAGRSLAVVGLNGAGKTTLVKLLARLYDPTDGRITVDGIDLRELDPHQWQRRVAAIFQDYQRYRLAARDNVGWGAADLPPDDDRLDAVAARAGATSVVDGLPDGWDTPLSRQLTGGIELSGGQWQRLALARALFAVEGGASILVLDEPSANLDARAEADLYDRFLDVTAGLTTIVISHRFSTVRRADRIVVLEGGRVVEQGTHEELVAHGGRYEEMFRLQATRYADAPAATTAVGDQHDA